MIDIVKIELNENGSSSALTDFDQIVGFLEIFSDENNIDVSELLSLMKENRFEGYTIEQVPELFFEVCEKLDVQILLVLLDNDALETLLVTIDKTGVVDYLCGEIHCNFYRNTSNRDNPLNFGGFDKRKLIYSAKV